MTFRNLFGFAAICVQLCFTSLAHAQLIEDIELKREGANAVAQVRFVMPVQYQRSVAAKTGSLVQVFYTVLPGADLPQLVTGERRLAGGGGLPQMIVTDEAVSNDGFSRRKLLIRFSEPTKFTIRSGRTRQSIEVVLEDLGASVSAAAEGKTLPVDERRFAIILQSSTDPGVQLTASIPVQLQDAVVFTSRRVSDGKTLFDSNLGYFATLVEAENALGVLLKRFPNASVVDLQSPKSTSSPQDAPSLSEANVSVTPPTSASDVEASAAKLLAQADAANDRGDYQDAITALDTLLGLPPNAASRRAQEQIGITRLKAGDAQRARGEFETFLKLYPTGSDSEQIRQFLANLPQRSEAAQVRRGVEAATTTSGSVSMFYYGGQSKVQSQDFQDSPLSGLPTLVSQSDLSATDQKQLQTNVDLNWRYRDADKDQRFVFRDTYSADLLPDRPNKNRLSALYFDQRNSLNGTSFKIGRQSPSGGGVLYRFDGAQAGYSFAPKWKVNAVYGVPTDTLLDSRRNFYGVWIDADALTPHMGGSAYINQQMIDGEIDRRGLGTELRYFNEGIALSGQLDYDQVLQGLNIATLQGSWQFPDTTVVNFLLDRRSTPIRSLGNILFFQDPSLATPARNIQDLLATTPIDTLRGQVNGITSFQNQAMLGFTTPLSPRWQTGANLNYTNVDEIKPVAVILPSGQAATGDLWSVGLQLIGSNLYSQRDTHVFSVNLMTGPTYNGTLLSYNNLMGINEEWQLEPSIRYYLQTDSTGNKMKRWTPGMRTTYRVAKRVSLESELSYEIADTQGPTRVESSTRLFYYLGGRLDF